MHPAGHSHATKNLLNIADFAPMFCSKKLAAATTCGVLTLMVLSALLLIVARPAQAQTFTVLHVFTGKPADGFEPLAGVALDAFGNLYGATVGGGSRDRGTVFKVDTTGKETVLHSFPTKNGDGVDPFAGVVLDVQGNVYGTTRVGGIKMGTVFKVDTTGKETILHTFTGTANGDGANPRAVLTLDAQGNIYGTTYVGGAKNAGTVFKLDTAGVETILHSFTQKDGRNPLGSLVFDAQGNLYGTTFAGGAKNTGTVFKLDTTGKETVLHSFVEPGGDGAFPLGDLAIDAQGNLYGTTISGGDPACYQGCGTVFKVDPTGQETVLYRFAGDAGGSTTPTGVIVDAQGNLYGTTNLGGAHGIGSVYKLDAVGNFTVLHSFDGNDGAFAEGVVLDGHGNLYGVAGQGGGISCEVSPGCGTVFKLVP
jgi:uncharacterized repeat protein (TIGR03803 family)